MVNVWRSVTKVSTWWPKLLLVAIVVLLSLELSYFWRDREYLGLDFHAYEAAARVGEHSGWSHIYNQVEVRASERELVPQQITLRFISPPLEAWLAAAMTPLPYWVAYAVWAVVMFSVMAFALWWSSFYTGRARVLAVAAAIVPWWVLHSAYVGQVAPLVAACVLIGWRLVREKRCVGAGLVLSVILLKPQVAVVTPMALLAAGRRRAFVAWAAGAITVAAASLLTLGPNGLSAYIDSVQGLPASSSDATLRGVSGLSGIAEVVVGIVVAGAALLTAYRGRARPGIGIAAGVLASLISSPYLFENDLCLFGAAGWILWHELPTPLWRASLTAIWILAATHLGVSRFGAASLNMWPLVELAAFFALVITVWISPPVGPEPERITPRARAEGGL